jgi:DNA ligase-1
MTLFARVADTSRQLAATSARRAKIDLLADCLRGVAPEEAAAAAAFLAGAPRQGRLGLGPRTVLAVTAPPAATPALSISDVDAALTRLLEPRGSGSAAARREVLAGLLARASADEQEFLRRMLLGELRQGALEAIVLEGIAQAAGVTPAAVRRAAMLSGDLGAVAEAALAHGDAGLARFALRLFQPLQPMLAQSAEDAREAVASLGTAALEWKLDGARIQVHREGGEVRVFTRSLLEVTAAVPEVVEAALRLPARALILDGEAIALGNDGRPRPFQETMRRFGRRRDVAQQRDEIPLSPFFFDVLHTGGADLIDLPAADRLRALAELVPPALSVPRLVTADAAAAEAFAQDALAHGHEGIMAKALDFAYEAGRRGAGWLKVKPVRTLDLVVLAAEWGSGRRRGWLSNLHLGARDPATGGFVMLGKTFKGLTDELLAWQTRRFLELEVARDEHTVFLRPELLVEIALDGVQSSPHYPAGMALRFARVRRYRPDKSPAEADTVATVRALHAR